MTFQIHPLPLEQFSSLFGLSDKQLSELNAVRMTVDASPGTPCRVSMEDAAVGEEVILFNHQHLKANSPYQSSHAVFVRKDATQANLSAGEVPKLFRHRLMSIRAFNKDHMMVDANAVEGTEVEQAIEDFFSLPEVGYIHLHYAKPGCFAASVSRA